jgi:hypothetical protein
MTASEPGVESARASAAAARGGSTASVFGVTTGQAGGVHVANRAWRPWSSWAIDSPAAARAEVAGG